MIMTQHVRKNPISHPSVKREGIRLSFCVSVPIIFGVLILLWLVVLGDILRATSGFRRIDDWDVKAVNRP